ncbi:hypothetical protein [Achromobacter aegrifaciens]
MKSYPSFNWWAGNLRKHESRLCFTTRFCVLNSIRLNRLRLFLGADLEDEIPLRLGEVKRLAFLLRENISVAISVFSPNIEQLKLLRTEKSWPPRSTVRYCDACAAQGFHSYLHEIPWILRCPFHSTELKICSSKGNHKFGVSILATRMASLCNLLEERCPRWPQLSRLPAYRRSDKLVRSLESWLTSASQRGTQLQVRQLWDKWHGDGRPVVDSDRIVGYYCALVPMPACVIAIVGVPNYTWQIQRWSFGNVTIEVFKSVLRQIGLSLALDFYAKTKAYSAEPTTHLLLLRKIQMNLREKHGVCRCRWRLVRSGWVSTWLHSPADAVRGYAINCPYNEAIKELEGQWGCYEDVLSTQGIGKERSRLVDLSEMFFAMGLIRYKHGVTTATKSLLEIYQKWPCYEWDNASSLTGLLAKIAECEVAVAGENLQLWLDQIESGGHPAMRKDEPGRLEVLVMGESLELLQWTSHR